MHLQSSSIAPAAGCCCSSPSAARRSCGGTCSRCCDSFLTRFSVAGAVGLVCCVVGAVMFAVCSHSAANLTLQLMQEAFNMTYGARTLCMHARTSKMDEKQGFLYLGLNLFHYFSNSLIFILGSPLLMWGLPLRKSVKKSDFFTPPPVRKFSNLPY